MDIKRLMQAVEETETKVAGAIKDITELRRYDLNNGRGRVMRWLHRLLDKSMALSMAMFISASLLSVVLSEAHAIQLYGVTVIFALLFAATLGLAVPVLTMALDILFMVKIAFWPSEFYSAEARHDLLQSSTLVRYPAEVLELADKWIEQKMKRLERRLVRFVGGGDKVALIVVIGLAWASWKELDYPKVPAAMLGSVNVMQCVLAFGAGLVLAGILVNRKLERLGFQRDLLALARHKLERLTKATEASNAAERPCIEQEGTS